MTLVARQTSWRAYACDTHFHFVHFIWSNIDIFAWSQLALHKYVLLKPLQRRIIHPKISTNTFAACGIISMHVWNLGILTRCPSNEPFSYSWLKKNAKYISKEKFHLDYIEHIEKKIFENFAIKCDKLKKRTKREEITNFSVVIILDQENL